jgi:hypothetical protein
MNLCVSSGNTKLGKILNISMPIYSTCVGKSEWCVKECYAMKYQKRYKNCRISCDNNFELSKNQNFSELVINRLSQTHESPVRIHVSGDFYDENYIDSWIKICSTLPKFKFWTYTRSWIIPNLLNKIKELNQLKNIQVFLSTDTTTQSPPKGFRIAYIADDTRAKGFRCSHDLKIKKSCLECGHCFNTRKGNIIFGK